MKDAEHRVPVQIGPRCRHDGGPRRLPLRLIVIHDAEAPSDAAKGVAAYGSRTDREVSWHFVVDDNVAIRQLPDDVIAWTAPGTNRDGLQIELCGYAHYSRLDWYRHQDTLKRGAWVCARWARLHGIPARWLTDKELRDGVTEGFSTHAQASRVFGGDHHDPGKNFPLSYFLSLVRRRLKWLDE